MSELSGMSAPDRREAARAARAPGLPRAVRELLKATTAHDRVTAAHSARVVSLARKVSRALGLDGRRERHVALVALLHDVGKTRVPRRILDKPGALTGREWAAIRAHPGFGAELVARHPELAHVAPAIRATHERWDGEGYPDGLAGSAIPLASRIGFVCDSFDAMISDRPYRPAMSRAAALEEVRREASGQFCPVAAEALVAVESPPWLVLGPPRAG